MKLRLLIQVVVVVSIVLLCAGFGIYSYLRLNSVEQRQDFDLYTLVPQDVTAVLETDHMAKLVEEIDRLDCSKENHFLNVSELFAYLKEHLYTLLENTPHGLSKQMNKMLISFHEPDTPMNQVLYCSLGAGDYELVESFVEKYSSANFPAKRFDYRSEEIRIYPMADGRFLSAYFTSDFLVLSFQKRLIEQVIDVRKSKKSLMNFPSFKALYAGKHSNVSATVYVRMKGVEMGNPADGVRSQTQLASWAEFDMKFDADAIYCSGVSYGQDSTQTFVNALRKQQPVEGFCGDLLPVSTFFYNRWALSDKESWFAFTARQEYTQAVGSDYVEQRDKEWMAYLNDHAGGSVTSCLFLPQEVADRQQPCAVVCIPLDDEWSAEHRLRSLLRDTPREEDVPPLPQGTSTLLRRLKAQGHTPYALPRNSLFTQLTGITGAALHPFACFYRGHLLLAPDALSLSSYIESLEAGRVLDGTPLYEGLIGSLSPHYNFLMMADMEQMLSQPEAYVRLIPNFFFRQADFFSRFLFAVQFTCTEGVAYPNIVLLYKGEEEVAR